MNLEKTKPRAKPRKDGKDTVCDREGHLREEVRSANAVTVYGWRCVRCTKQWMRTACAACGDVAEHVARPAGKKNWMCGPCRRAAAGK